jgi:uncharacterized membrane protein (UPF0127 family)
MRRILIIVGIGLLAAACSPDDSVATTTTSTTSTTVPIVVPPSLVDYEVEPVQVGDRMPLLAIADNPSLRSQGLQGVTDLEDLDGMLFFWRHDGSVIWMKDTLIPLDIVWFNEDGTYKDRASMVPCTQDPCKTYAPADGLDFRYAIEANPGDLDWIDESTVIVYSD